jgi:hypothetical protein
MSEGTDREPNLEELAETYGAYTLAACQYRQIAHAARMLKQCSWWEIFRKRRIVRIMTEVIKRNDQMRGFK